MEINKQQMTMWYFALAFLAVVFLQDMFAAGRHTETLAYSEFKALLHAGKVSDVVVTDTAITGKLSTSGLQGLLPAERLTAISAMTGDENYFTTVKVDDTGLVADLEAAKVRFSGKIESRLLSSVLSWIVPMLIFFALYSFLMKRMGGAQGLLSIGKSKAKVYMEKQTGVTFDDVAGIDEAKAELVEVVEFLKTPDRYRRLGGKIPKGVMLVGAPGTGKTLLAKAVAGEAGVPFFSMSGSGFVEMFVGVGAARVRDLFDQAQKMAPCIIFIDELDALGKARGVGMMGGNDEREQTLNQLLVEMDGFDTNKGVIIMAATNRPEVLDPALLRPGRFDRHVALDPPDLRGREQILRVHVKEVKLAPSVDLTVLAARTPGFAGADLANLVNEAALRAARKDKDAVDMTDFDEATDRIVGGLEKRQRVMNPVEKETVAYHEAGHALVAESRPHADKVAKISIIPRGIAALGYTQQQPTEDRYLLRRGELLERLDVLLGGRVAEEIVFGDISTGAQNDLQRATDLARHMVTRYGMSERLGLASYEDRQGTPFLNLSMPSGSKEYSEGTAQAIDEEVTKLLSDAQTRVRETLTARRPALEALAKMLLEKETIDRAALDRVLAGRTAPIGDQPGAVIQPALHPVDEETALAATKTELS